MRPITEENTDDKTVWCGNLSEEVTDEILFELFNQAGPVESVRRPRDQNGRPKSFAFILYKHECSVPYALELFIGTKLFNRNINLNSRSTLKHIPVLDTHLTEHTESRFGVQNVRGNEADNNTGRESEHRRGREDSRYENVRKEHGRYESHRREEHRYQGSSRRHEEKDHKEPTSWAELNALRGKNSLVNGYRSDLQGSREYTNQRNDVGMAQPLLDFNNLMQMGHQMLPPQLGGMVGLSNLGGMLPMGLGPSLGSSNMFPSMQGRMSGGDHRMPDRGTERRDHFRDGRDSRRRDHPYDDRGRNESRDVHRRHDRGYSSARSSHDREKRDRRSR